ncbi:MAG: hypothetical protein ACLRZH_18445 [Ruthenibacterium lactatiformans]
MDVGLDYTAAAPDADDEAADAVKTAAQLLFTRALCARVLRFNAVGRARPAIQIRFYCGQ